MPAGLRTQANRTIAINTPLGPEKVAIQSIRGQEELGRLFQYELELLSEDDTIVLEDLLGQNVTVRIGLGESAPDVRYINGYINRISQHEYRGGLAVYRATLVPWLWFLTRHSDCRIFQEMTFPDIVKEVCRQPGFTDIKDQLADTYETRDFCVQYRETTFNFVSRLMEQEGIYYYFAHENGKHELVLCDAPDAHAALAGGLEIPFYPPDAGKRNEQHIRGWTVQKQIQSLKYELSDFDFEKPNAPVVSNSQQQRDHATGPWEEMFDYPGEYVTSAEAQHFSTIRLQELQARYEQISGQGDHLGIVVGGRFKLTLPAKGLRPDQAREYVVTGTSLQASQDLFGSGGEAGGEDLYSIAFTVIAATEHFRPARTTPKPLIQGPQTAIVAGKEGEEIWTDEYGRVKVQFHWDRYSAGDEKSSCWCRVSQNWAGKRWGAMFMPRIGQEVIVEFLEGDPDRPIITGRVYNGQNMPPYKPTEMGTVSTIKSNSSKGGAGFNEIRFEDKKNEEQVFIHAQKNMDVRVLNDRFETVVNNRHLVVENDKYEHVKHDRHLVVDNDRFEHIKRDVSITVDGKHAEAVTGSYSQKVTGDVAEVFEANQSTEITDNLYIKAKNICLEAVENITIKVGKTSIALETTGVGLATKGDIKAEATKNIELKATTEFKAEGTAAVKVKGAQVDVKADGMATFEGTGPTAVKSAAILTVQGSLVKIN
ncbi:MAG: type VI secretion system tip protein VgrG [Leptolyngbya sp. PLA3]|nr:MAG: type VI secretion system tip protein VgrG [Cyanobacteria bacterium CYA]MCE7969169.1 type VI secretion system tip protein VgrG [Leptolyngbya sp. PL-A3]